MVYSWCIHGVWLLSCVEVHTVLSKFRHCFSGCALMLGLSASAVYLFGLRPAAELHRSSAATAAFVNPYIPSFLVSPLLVPCHPLAIPSLSGAKILALLARAAKPPWGPSLRLLRQAQEPAETECIEVQAKLSFPRLCSG